MDSARMSQIAPLLCFGVVAALIGLGCSDSNSGGGSGGTQAACGYACVESATQRQNVSARTVSPSSESDCQLKKESLQSETGYGICADDLVTVSSSGACDQEGGFFLFELDAALIYCTVIFAPDPVTCVEGVFRDHPSWNFPEKCIACAGEKYAAFLACVGAASPLDEDSLKACIGTWVSDSAACSP